jgi:hypothetical protein
MAENPGEIQKFIQQQGLTLPVAMDPSGQLASAFGGAKPSEGPGDRDKVKCVASESASSQSFVVIDHKQLIEVYKLNGSNETYTAEQRELLAGYLAQGPVLIATLSPANDEINPLRPGQLRNCWQTDGTYVWFGMLGYYVEEYGLALPEDFVYYAARSRYTLPAEGDGFVTHLENSHLMVDAALTYEHLHGME